MVSFDFIFLTDEDYIRKKFRDMDASTDQSLKGLMWDSAQVRKVLNRVFHILCITYGNNIIMQSVLTIFVMSF